MKYHYLIMTRQYRSPQIKRSQINKGQFIGKGQHPTTFRRVYATEVYESGRKFQTVCKTPGFFFGPSETSRIIQNYRKIKMLGLPVPAFVRSLREEVEGADVPKISLIAEDVRKRVGKIYDCHKDGAPVFLQKLRVKKDPQLIKALAQDLATLHNNDIIPFEIDFWHFYKIGKWRFWKRGTWERIIVDFNKFSRFKAKTDLSEMAEANLKVISHYMRADVWKKFHEEYLKIRSDVN